MPSFPIVPCKSCGAPVMTDPADAWPVHVKCPTCNQHDCTNKIAFRFTWPGHDEQYICDQHVSKLQAIAEAMGLHLQVIPL